MHTTHTMKLRQEPFDKIKSGTKVIESRLFDDKRKQIRMGDVIEFQLEPDLSEKVQAKVVGLLNYPTFADMMNDLPATYFGWEESQQAIDEINQFYSAEDQNNLSVLGIRLQLVA